MSRDIITVGSTMRIPLLYQGEYSQWHERFMNYLEEQTDGEAMINSIQNGDHPLPIVAQVSLAGTAPNAPPTLKDPKFWTAEEKKTRKIDHALERQMRGSEYDEQDRKVAILYEYETFKATEGEQLLDTYLCYLQVINDLKKCGYKKDNCELNYKFLNNLQPEWKQYDPLALVAEKTKVSKSKEKVVVQSESEGSDDEDIRDLKKITALLAKVFNQKKYYAKPTNNILRTSSANKKLEYKAKVKDYNYYKIKMLLAKKDSDEQVLLAKDQAWIESSIQIKRSMQIWSLWLKWKRFFQIRRKVHHLQKKPLPGYLLILKVNLNIKLLNTMVLSDSEESSSFAEETIVGVSSDSESESEY
uniref:Gag-Pol polyprotein n=1 Tax=Tanacetum cinerariifolium TaxID=118510 RepID=A0A699KLZ8_TANCI|nr:hypothetical protein [Tanacetum cinerariifolium]